MPLENTYSEEKDVARSTQGDSFIIKGLSGEHTLEGDISVSGAKNDILKIMAGVLLFEDAVHIENVPDVLDVVALSAILEEIGMSVENIENGIVLKAPKQAHTVLPKDGAKKLRASVVLTGPLLSRYGSVSFPHPGGCVIGARPIDIFIHSFELMGGTYTQDDTHYTLSAPNGLHGADIFFPLASVTATETLMMAAVLARGTTIIRNAAMEPEIQNLAQYLIACGANIQGVGTPTITIVGGELLHAREKTYTVIPDRIEAGSFAILGALSGKQVHITNCNPLHIRSLLDIFDRAGVAYEQDETSLTLREPREPYRSISVRTHEYPGFSTDLQAPLTIFLTQVQGESLVFETLFEGRLRYTDDIVRMGADITMFDPHRVLVRGPKKLIGKDLEAPDLRAGLAYIIAGVIAQGTSTVRAARYIDRGYSHIEKRLQKIGVDIVRA